LDILPDESVYDLDIMPDESVYDLDILPDESVTTSNSLRQQGESVTNLEIPPDESGDSNILLFESAGAQKSSQVNVIIRKSCSIARDFDYVFMHAESAEAWKSCHRCSLVRKPFLKRTLLVCTVYPVCLFALL
jgi:hypothetical protein